VRWKLVAAIAETCGASTTGDVVRVVVSSQRQTALEYAG
jgi:hypothetical protein